MTGFRANLLVQSFRPILQKQKKRELRILEVMKDIKENTLQHYYYYYYKTRDSFKIGTISVKEGRVIWGVSVEEKSYNKGNEIGYTWCTAFRILWVRENSKGPSYNFLNTSTPLPPIKFLKLAYEHVLKPMNDYPNSCNQSFEPLHRTIDDTKIMFFLMGYWQIYGIHFWLVIDLAFNTTSSLIVRSLI